VIARALVLAVLVQMLGCAPQRQVSPSRMQRVRVAADGNGFALERSGEPFVPWGFNYLGRFGELVEESWATDWRPLETDFREMKDLGANVVRVHLQFGTFMKTPGQVDLAELRRLRRMLDLARDRGLYLDVTGLSCYRRQSIPAWYDALDEAARWEAQAQWWSAVAEVCAGHPAVFCYDLMNEPVIGGQPKPGEPRWIAGELGGLWFVQRLTDDARGRTQEDIADAWSAKLVAAIRAKDPAALITVGAIPWAHVWPTAKPLFYSPRVGRHFDFVSIHLYPNKGEVAKAVTALAVYDVGKPLVVEETFPLSCSIEELDEFIDRTSDRADGWVSHYFGRTVEEHRRGAEPAGAMVAQFLEYWREKGKALTSQRRGITPPRGGEPHVSQG
jgi:hypothetical protein